VKLTSVSLAEARRIAVRAQLLDGSATGVLDTVRRLGFLQIDPISTVAPPQYLVLWSRLGPFERSELDRLLWQDRKLIEWNAFIYPIESLPLIQARMRGHRRATKHSHDRWRKEFLEKNAAFRRYVLRELERRGPLLSRELEDRSDEGGLEHRWYGNRYVGLMLGTLHIRGEIAVVGRRGGQRLWALADAWYPATETVPLREAERLLAEKRFRALGVKLEGGRLVVHPEVNDGPMGSRVTFLSPFDRLVHDRNRAEALWDFFYRLEMYVPKAKRVHGYYVLPILRGDRLIGRIEPVLDRQAGVLRVNGIFAEPGAPASAAPGIARATRRLAKWLGAVEIVYSRRVPDFWREALRA
jgi:uncharacterized protein YcaQ